MRFAAVTTVLAGAGLLGGHALADTVPIPPVPTVTVPALPVTVTAPTATVSAPTATVTTPSATVALPTSSTSALPASPVQAPLSTQAGSAVAGAPVGSASSGAGSASSGGSEGSPSSASAAPGRDRPGVERFRSSRSWIATSGPKGRRVTTLTFVLPRAARVVFVVKQLSPICRIAGRFAVNGRAGRNRIRFPSRGSKLKLDPGTYRITARTRAGQVIQRLTIVVVEGGTPTRDQIIAARAANVCSIAAGSDSTGASNTSNVSSSPQDVQRPLIPGKPSASGPSEAVLASTVERAARAVRPVVVALLVLAIVLLAAASLPRPALVDSRANELLTRHRTGIAALGTASFVAVVIVLLLG
jgi:hypothetical protein